MPARNGSRRLERSSTRRLSIPEAPSLRAEEGTDGSRTLPALRHTRETAVDGMQLLWPRPGGGRASAGRERVPPHRALRGRRRPSALREGAGELSARIRAGENPAYDEAVLEGLSAQKRLAASVSAAAVWGAVYRLVLPVIVVVTALVILERQS